MRRRIIKGLKEVELLDKKPPFIPDTKHRGSRKAGLIYEQKVIKALKSLVSPERVIGNPWFRFVDSRGEGWCSPDFVITGEPFIIGECKLTVTNAAEKKLTNIYLPVCELYFNPSKPPRLVQIAKNLKQDWDDIRLNGLEDIYDEGAKWQFGTWIWRKP